MSMMYLSLRDLSHQLQVWEEPGGPFEWLALSMLCRQSTPGCCFHLQALTSSTWKAVGLYAAMATSMLQSNDASKVQCQRQQNAYQKNGHTRAAALLGLAPFAPANDIHVSHAKAQAR